MSFPHPIWYAPFMRSVAIAALMGATMLAGPLSAARADTATSAAIQLAQAVHRPGRRGSHRLEGGDRRAADHQLHAALKITPDQEAKWKEVAQDMRENAAAMDKLVAESRKIPPQNMTAVDDLKMYQKFAQAHVDGMKNLLSHFEAFYAAMPDAQKKIADEVFRSTKS